MCTVAFMSGYVFRFANKKKAGNKVLAIESTDLQEFITTSKDSTYLVFAFTYTCPHCMNSVENLKQYEVFGVVDKVIGLAVKDSIAEKQFIEIFHPDFLIKNIEPQNLFRLTKTFPTAYFIKNDSIIAELSGVLPCSFVFEKQIVAK
jgi:hypothetical protein